MGRRHLDISNFRLRLAKRLGKPILSHLLRHFNILGWYWLGTGGKDRLIIVLWWLLLHIAGLAWQSFYNILLGGILWLWQWLSYWLLWCIKWLNLLRLSVNGFIIE